MLRYLLINNPYRVILVFIVLTAINIPLMIQMPLTASELYFFLLGEKVVHGSIPYIDIVDITSPLSVGVYSIVYFLVGKHLFFYRSLAWVFILVQSFYLNKIFNKNDIFLIKANVASLVAGLLLSCFYGFLTLSPPLLALPFITALIGYSYKAQHNGLNDQEVYISGLYLGIAVLFYFPCILFVFYLLMMLVVSPTMIVRKIIVACVGFLLPIFLVGILLFNLGALDAYLSLIRRTLFVDSLTELSTQTILILFFIPFLFFILSVLRLLFATRYTSTQRRIQRLMILYSVLFGLSFLFYSDRWMYHLVLGIPVFAFFITHYFLLFNNRIIGGFTFFLFFVSIPLLNFGLLNGFLLKGRNNFSSFFVKKNEWGNTRKKILVLGKDLSYYRANSLATPYLNYSISEYYFDHLDQYEIVVEVFDCFKQELPDYIVDLDHRMRKLSERIPLLQKKYIKIKDTIYKRID